MRTARGNPDVLVALREFRLRRPDGWRHARAPAASPRPSESGQRARRAFTVSVKWGRLGSTAGRPSTLATLPWHGRDTSAPGVSGCLPLAPGGRPATSGSPAVIGPPVAAYRRLNERCPGTRPGRRPIRWKQSCAQSESLIAGHEHERPDREGGDSRASCETPTTSGQPVHVRIDSGRMPRCRSGPAFARPGVTAMQTGLEGEGCNDRPVQLVVAALLHKPTRREEAAETPSPDRSFSNGRSCAPPECPPQPSGPAPVTCGRTAS
jgi:hypothetical protein